MRTGGQPPQVAARHQRGKRAEHQHLVGQRVEERTRTRDAVATREVAVDAVGRRTSRIQNVTAGHDAPPDAIITSRIGLISRRVIVTAFAGVASAD